MANYYTDASFSRGFYGYAVIDQECNIVSHSYGFSPTITSMDAERMAIKQAYSLYAGRKGKRRQVTIYNDNNGIVAEMDRPTVKWLPRNSTPQLDLADAAARELRAIYVENKTQEVLEHLKENYDVQDVQFLSLTGERLAQSILKGTFDKDTVTDFINQVYSGLQLKEYGLNAHALQFYLMVQGDEKWQKALALCK